ncbi:hypothetical protein PG988_005701 [Apiospora saccharicola]
MPVTIRPSSHRAKPIRAASVDEEDFATSSTQILEEADGSYHGKHRGNLLRSSFGPAGDELSQPEDEPVCADKNGLIGAAASAYAQHHHLVLRPEDFWIAITTQLRCYMNAHAEEVRHLIVPHQGQKPLEVQVPSLEAAMDVPLMVQRFGDAMDEHVLDPTLRQWFVPDFSTTTPDDVAVASIVAMAAYSAYFSYWVHVICGLPSVTLLGERADYEDILQRLDRLAEFGQEPAEFAAQLRPILRRCVRTFDVPEEPALKEFWNNICTVHVMGCGGDRYFSGWITAFAFWQPSGKRTDYRDLGVNRFGDSETRLRLDQRLVTGVMPDSVDLGLTYDGVTYRAIESDDLPGGSVKVPVTIIDLGGSPINAELLAGSVAVSCKKSGEVTTSGYEDLDTLQPKLGWFMYERKEVP